MKRRLVLGIGAVAAAGGASAVAPPAQRAMPRLHWRETALPALGTTVWLRAAHAEPAVAEAALADAAATFHRADAAMNLHRADSALVRLNREGELRDAPPELQHVLAAALTMARASGGAFDPTVQPLWRLWADAAAQRRRPRADELAAARASADWRAVQWQHARPERIALRRRGMALTLNGIAQGFAADAAATALRRHGIADALVDAGEWQPIGHAPEGGPWQLGIAARAAQPGETSAAPLLARLVSDGRAIACSADDAYRFSADGRDHHILDPRSGRSPVAIRRVVVAAPAAWLADALTKPLMMAAGAQDALALARRFGADALVVERGGRWRASAGMPLAAR